MEMDIAAMSFAKSQGSVGNAIGIDLLKKAMNSDENGQKNIINMLSEPQNPNIGNVLDARA
ncbi:MAG: YjfB family protein [Clostridium sp.]|nr:YjfB family protein [Clostridium sp.]